MRYTNSSQKVLSSSLEQVLHGQAMGCRRGGIAGQLSHPDEHHPPHLRPGILMMPKKLHSASSSAGMELSRALQCQPCRILKGHTPFASAGRPRALWPSRRCEVFRLAGLARSGESVPWLTHPAAPRSDAWPHNCMLERRCLLLLLLAAAAPAAQAAAGAGAPFYDTSESLIVYI